MTELAEILEGRTDAIFEFLESGGSATATDGDGVSLIQWCAYYGDVSAMKYLLTAGAKLDSLGDDFGLNAACFHGHWRLSKFLIERGADVNRPLADTGETPLHAALCTVNRLAHNLVMKVLLAHGANPNLATKPNVETADSCATFEPKQRHPCTVRQRSVTKRAFRCCSTRALPLTPEI